MTAKKFNGWEVVAISAIGPGGLTFFERGSGRSSDVGKIISMPADAIKKVGIVLDDVPTYMHLNTMLSDNLPASSGHMFPKLGEKKNAIAFEGEILLDEFPDRDNPNEIIVDNEDAGFSLNDAKGQKILEKIFRSGDKKTELPYEGLNFWRPPRTWVATVNAEFYGTYVRSAYYTKSGGGERKAIWTATIEDNGFYDIYCFNSEVQFFMKKGGGKNGGRFNFLVHHDDGIEEVIFDRNDADKGWNYLGQFYLSDGTALDYAWGIRVSRRGGARVISHGGSWPGWTSKAIRLVDVDASVALLTTSSDAVEVNDIGWAIADLLAESSAAGT